MIIYWNAPKGMTIYNKYGNVFQDLRHSFVRMDGNLFRMPRFACNSSPPLLTGNHTVNIKRNSIYVPSPLKIDGLIVQDINDVCSEIFKIRDAKYRTHQFYLPFVAAANDSFDVTWVSQMSIDRLQLIEHLFRLWEGNYNVEFILSCDSILF